jgi:hypothetical protein
MGAMTRALVFAGLLLCACQTKRPNDAPPAASSAPVKVAGAHLKGDHFELDGAANPCKTGTECSVTLKLVTSADYHINKEYPYKFTASAAPGIEFLGKGDATAFTRANGDFVEQGEKAGTMTVRFKPAAAGETHVTGTYKFSVCSAERCQIEQEKMDVAVPVM